MAGMLCEETKYECLVADCYKKVIGMKAIPSFEDTFDSNDPTVYS